MLKYWRETVAVAIRILRELGRRRRSLIFWLIFPFLLILINGFLIAERAQLELDQAMAIAAPASLVGAALFFSCLGGTVATIVAEREQQTIKRLFLSPLSGISYFLGIFLAHSAIAFTQALLVYGIALAFGANFQGNFWGGLLIVLLSIAAYVGVGFILGTQLAKRTEDVNALVATFGVPLLILGGSFLPASFFPETLLNIAKFNPIYHMNEALINLWYQGDSWSEIAEHWQFLSLFSLLMVSTGWLSYRRMVEVEKRF